MRVLTVFAKWLFILCLPVLLFTATAAWLFNSPWVYTNGFKKYDVATVTGLSSAELEKVAIGLIRYWNSGEEYIDITVIKNGQPMKLFNQRELMHLKDVKDLVWLDYRVFLGLLAYVLGFAGVSLFWHRPRYWRRLAREVLAGSGITLALMLVLGLGILFGFERLFLQFHLISFTNELWQLDPATDYLIMLVPQGFWYDTFLLGAMIIAGLALILGGAAGGHLLFNKTKQTT
ncbi:MAG: TIGR01906 family membrane protein [Chloroflexi bacterium]|nr:TIGR01906 family membrane protein [Chloroflexota bacterium]